MEANFFRKEVIRLKCRVEEGGWFTRFPRGSHGVGLWKAISKESSLLINNCSLLLSDGRRIKFWDDIFCGEGTLKDMPPNLYNLAENKWVSGLHSRGLG